MIFRRAKREERQSALWGSGRDSRGRAALTLALFAMSLVFLSVYLSSRSIWIQNPLVTSFVVLLAALVKGAALVLLWAVFLSVEGFWLGAARYIIMEALVAALLAPVLFALLRRGQNYVEKFRVAAQ